MDCSMPRDNGVDRQRRRIRIVLLRPAWIAPVGARREQN